MSITVDFIFDFASPNAYFCHKVLPDIEARTGAIFTYIPCLLGGLFKHTGNQAPMLAFGEIKGKLAYEMRETERFIAKHGLTKFTMNPHFPVNTLLVMRGLIAAEQKDVAAVYREAVVSAMWEDGKKMDDADVVLQVLDAAGLDGAGILAETQNPAVKQTLIDNTQKAADRGAFGIPTFYVGEEMYFGKERLGQVEEEILRIS